MSEDDRQDTEKASDADSAFHGAHAPPPTPLSQRMYGRAI